jgi:hypothetical protein
MNGERVNRPYTVCGHYRDNGQLWAAWVRAPDPGSAALAAMGKLGAANEWDRVDVERDIMVSFCFEGHIHEKGALERPCSGNDIRRLREDRGDGDERGGDDGRAGES